MRPRPPAGQRRWLLKAAALALAAPAARAHNEAGLVKPALAAPALPLTLHDGRKTTLPKLLTGQATALQLMFTGCSATCPIQGALFGAVQQRLLNAPGRLQLVSVTIDPLSDDARAMKTWLQRYGAGARWLGATPEVKDLDRWLDFLRARNQGADRHTAQVYYFNARAELVLRSTDFPPAEEVARLLNTLSTLG